MTNQNAQDFMLDARKLNDALAEADRAALRLAQYGPDHLAAAGLTRTEVSESTEQIRIVNACIAQARDTSDLIQHAAVKARLS